MTFSYFGGGTVYTGSFARARRRLYINYKFPVNTTAYVKDSARKGVLEKVTVHNVYLKRNIPTYYNENVIYEDNYKSLYNEYDLINENEAKKLALAYWQRRMDDAKSNLQKEYGFTGDNLS